MESTLLNAPTAQTFSISDLVEKVADGRVRIPSFQRIYRWKAPDVLALFDSVYRGYPVGSVLLWKNAAPAEVVHLGSLRIDAEAMPEALWVVDGQQRITSLAAVLLSKGAVDDPRFSVFFDLVNLKFVTGRKPTPRNWLPMNRVSDTRALLRWLAELQTSGATDQLVSTAEDLATRIREYKVPAYVVDRVDDQVLRTIFDRLNTFGKPLKTAEVFQALHGGRGGHKPEDLRTLGEQVRQLGFGDLPQNTLLRTVLALRGPDVYRDFRNEFDDDEDPTETFRLAAEALARVVGFLRVEAELIHIRTVPYRYIIPVLARFFALHPTPSVRSITLLRRWIWRDALAGDRRSTSGVSTLRDAARAVTSNESASVQQLISFVPSVSQYQADLSPRLNEARSRANIAMMGSWGPRSLIDGTTIDLPELFDQVPTPLQTVTQESSSTLANRMIHGATSSLLADLLIDSPLRQTDPVTFGEVLVSHGVEPSAIRALESGAAGDFLKARSDTLIRRLLETGSRLAEWGADDRPPLDELVVKDDDDE